MGNIKHAKTAAVDDGSAEVNANEWNNAHVIENGAILSQHIDSVALTKVSGHDKAAHDALTIDAGSVDTKEPGALSGNLAILDANARVQDSAKLEASTKAQVQAHAHSVLTGIGENDHHTKFTIPEHDVTTRHVLGTVVPHDALASLTEKAHGSLSGVSADQHHTQSHYSAHARAGADAIVRPGVVVDPAGKGDYATIQAAIDSLS